MRSKLIFLILIACSSTSAFAFGQHYTNTYGLVETSFDTSDKDNPFTNHIEYNIESYYSFKKDLSIRYDLKFEHDVDYNLDADTANTEFVPTFAVSLNFGDLNDITTQKIQDGVVSVINTTDVFNRFSKNTTRYDFKHKNDGLFTYNYGFDNLVFSFAYGTPQVEKDPYARYTQNSYKIQNTFSSSVGFVQPLTNDHAFKLHTAYSYAKNPYITKTKNESYVDFYNHYATAITYGKKTKGEYFALMHNKRDYTMTSESRERDYSIGGTEFVMAYSFKNGFRAKVGYEYISMEVDGYDGLDAIGVPIEFNYKANKNLSFFAGAYIPYKVDETEKKSKPFKAWNKEFGGYDENVYNLGTRYKF